MATARQRAHRLVTILDSHDAWERRTMADLRVAGFKFPSIEAARSYRKAQETLARMTADEVVGFVALLSEPKREKR